MMSSCSPENVPDLSSLGRDKLPILYSFRRCPYAMRARMALDVAGVKCRLREVVLRDKPKEMLLISPKGTVPVLQRVDGTVLEESRDVMLWALRENDPESWLNVDMEAAIALIDECDGPFKHALDRYKYPNRYDLPDRLEHRERGLVYLRTLNDRLSVTKGLIKDTFCLPDAAISPFVRQFANTDRDWFGNITLPHLKHWLSEIIEGPLFARIMQKYPQWQTGDEEPIFPPSLSA
ncbi:MAG: glutathione S-transferase [Pseudomonadota bacterium]